MVGKRKRLVGERVMSPTGSPTPNILNKLSCTAYLELILVVYQVTVVNVHGQSKIWTSVNTRNTCKKKYFL
mgnify:FL=1